MFDMRAYVATLAAVFLSLAIGILLGTVIVDKGTMANQQRAIMQGIRSDIKSALDDNKLLKDDIDKKKSFESAALPALIQNKLSGKTIVLLNSATASQESVKSVSSTVSQAGGQLSVLTLNETLKGVAGFEENLRTITSSSKELKSRDLIAKSLALAIALPDSPPTIDQLKKFGIINLYSPVKTAPTAVVINVSNMDLPEMGKMYQSLTAELKQYGLSVVFVEDTKAEKSMVNEYRGLGVATVDNVDEITGRISLAYCINGAIGNYGYKSGATSIVPDLKQTNQ